MTKRNILLVLVFMLLSLGVQAQNYSDIININTLISAMVNGRNPGSALTAKGYKHLKYHRVEGLGANNGVETYYKNCTVDRDGQPTSYSKGNTSIVEIGSVGFGPFISLQVYNRGAFNYICGKLTSIGYRLYNGGINGEQSFQKGGMIIDISHFGKTYMFTINSPRQ